MPVSTPRAIGHNGNYATLTAPRGEAQTATYGAKLVESYRNNGEILQR
jgi:hypothetical protein